MEAPELKLQVREEDTERKIIRMEKRIRGEKRQRRKKRKEKRKGEYYLPLLHQMRCVKLVLRLSVRIDLKK